MSVASERAERPFPGPARSAGWRRGEADLLARVDRALVRAQSVIASDIALKPVETVPVSQAIEFVMTCTWAAIDRLRSTERAKPGESAAFCSLVAELQELAQALYEHDRGYIGRRLAECTAGLTRLRAVETTAGLIDRVCEEFVRSGGFERVALSRVEDGMWKPWKAHFTTPELFQDWFDTWLGAAIPLDQLTLETKLIEQPSPVVIHDTASDPRVHPMVHHARSASYVVAPIMSGGTVLGFLHADHWPHERRADELDRDVLWMFTEGFGQIYERTLLLERLRTQRNQVQEAMAVVEGIMAELCNSEIELSRQPGSGSVVVRTLGSALTPIEADLAELTARERDVLELMVAGATNRTIADELVISEGTVKSHVKHILRKLGVVNRSQAIARYLGARA
jgi:DNA-binding CsgD family transcriptional regulator